MTKMHWRSFLFLTSLVAAAKWTDFVAPAVASESTGRAPNILVVVADDLGYGDLGCYGNPVIQTPHLDRLAADGLRLTHCYSAAANCSPARAALMTGRVPYRVGIYNQISFMGPMHLRVEEVTIATLLKQAGFATAQIGKWHLNGLFNLPGQPQPDDHGFEHWFGVQNNALPNHRNPYNFVRNGIPLGPQEGYSGQLVADEAIDWLGKKRDQAKPFFLYVAFNEPHEPIATAQQFTDLYDFPDDPSRAAYCGNVSQMDAALGRILASLDKLGLRENTIVWFTSDNGPARTRWHNSGSTGGLREFKGHLYEGGIRVPGIIRWPRHVAAGSVSAEPASGVDLLPTLCQIAGIAPPADRPLDGISIMPLLRGQALKRQQPLYWQFLWSASKPQVALRQGDWKIMATLDGPHPKGGAPFTAAEMKQIKTAGLAEFELYNLAEDPTEVRNLASTQPQKLAALSDLLTQTHRSVQAEGPEWPSFVDPRYEQSRIEWPSYTAKPLPPEKASP